MVAPYHFTTPSLRNVRRGGGAVPRRRGRRFRGSAAGTGVQPGARRVRLGLAGRRGRKGALRGECRAGRPGRRGCWARGPGGLRQGLGGRSRRSSYGRAAAEGVWGPVVGLVAGRPDPGRLLLAGGGGLGPNGPDGCGLVLVFHPRRFAGATQVACTSGRQGGHLMRSALSRAGPGARPTGGGRVGPDFYRDWEHLPEWHWSERAGRRVRTQHPRHRRPHHPTTRSAPPSRPPPPGPEDDPTAPCHTKPAPPGPRRCTYGAASYFTAVSEQSLARVSSPARSLPSARRERPWRATREGPLGRGAPWRSRPRRGPAGRRRYRRSCRPGHQLTGSSATPPSWTASVSVSGPVTGRLPGR